MKRKMGFHFRSISLPSRVQPINASKIENHLQKLKSCQISNPLSQTVPTTSQAIQSNLQLLAEMYNSVEEAAKIPPTQQQRKSMEESLESSIELLDSCNIIRELIFLIKENVQALQSALRRKGFDSSVQHDIITYTCFRKRMSKNIVKTLKRLKNLENKNGLEKGGGGDQSFVRVLKEVAILNIAILKGVLVFLSWPAAKSGGWNLVSRLISTKSVASTRDDSVISEVGSVDFAVGTLLGRIRNKGGKVVDVQILQRNLQNLDVCMEEFEKGFERLFKLLVRSRVTVLNILTDQLK